MKVLKAKIMSFGADIAGYSDMSSFDSKSRENLHNTISMGIALNPTIVGRIP